MKFFYKLEKWLVPALTLKLHGLTFTKTITNTKGYKATALSAIKQIKVVGRGGLVYS